MVRAATARSRKPLYYETAMIEQLPISAQALSAFAPVPAMPVPLHVVRTASSGFAPHENRQLRFLPGLLVSRHLSTLHLSQMLVDCRSLNYSTPQLVNP